MIKRFQALCSLSLITLTLCWFLWLIPFSKTDITHFRDLILKKKEQVPLLSTAEQQRTGITKELFIATPEGRLHHRIISASSTLTLTPNKHKVDVVEQLHNITCWTQEKLYETAASQRKEQQVRKLTAKEGLYRYSSQQFTADSVDFFLYRLPGFELPQNPPATPPLLKGHAQTISLFMADNTPQFRANQFKAELFEGKHP